MDLIDNTNSSHNTHRFPDDALPPEGEYRSLEEVRTSINTWAAPRGYAFVIGRSKKTPSHRTMVTFNCDRGAGRTPSSQRKLQRATTTRRTGCRFSITAKESLDKTTWRLMHRPGPGFDQHNHEPSFSQTAHPELRRLSTQHKATVNQFTQSGIAPKQVRSWLHANTDAIATKQDIYNCIAQGKRDLTKGQSNMHALESQLKTEGFWSQMRINDSARCTAVIFAHPESLEHLKLYPEVLILDCTYKTNKYKMPLLDIVGVDACQRTYCIAFAFLSGEEEDDYTWALQALQSVFETHHIAQPSVIITDRCLACMNAVASCFPASAPMLCLWHINKAVLTYCKPEFVHSKDDTEGLAQWEEFFSFWHEIVASPTEDIYNERLEKFKQKYIPSHVREVGYILETWLDLYKERFVKAWVDGFLHFSQYVTSRAEGIHELIKAHLNTSMIDLFDAWRSIKLVLVNQLSELNAMQAKQHISTPVNLSGALYSQVRGWISHEALRQVEAQRQRLLKEYPACTGTFMKTLGLPCVHTLKRLQDEFEPLKLYHFHAHWRLKRDGSREYIIEPHRRFDHFTATSTLPPTSTRREPCGFEVVDKPIQQKAPPKCSRCHQVGHNMRSKQCPLRYAHLSQTPAQSYTMQTSAQSHTIPTSAQSPTLSQIIVSSGPSSPSGSSIITIQVRVTPPAPTRPAPVLHFGDPRAIHQRYVKAREDWYATLPRGALRTNQAYRTAMGLPLRYSKVEYEYATRWNQMGSHCRDEGMRPWTREEQIAYIDWDRAETARVERNVERELAENHYTSTHRDLTYIWDQAADNVQQQEALYSTTGDTR